MNNSSERIQRLILLAAIIVGVAVYALFTATEIGALTILFPILAAISAVGLFVLLIASALSCRCRDNEAFCGPGLLAAFGGGGAIIASLLTAIAGTAADTGFRIGTAVTFALVTLLLGGIIGLIAESNNCVSGRCSCSCRDDGNDDDCYEDDGDCSDRPFPRDGYYR